MSYSQWAEGNDGSSTALTARTGAASAMDLANNRMYMYGGISGSTYGDTWYYDLVANTWTQFNDGSGTSPTIRSTHSMVLDTANGRLYIFGGK